MRSRTSLGAVIALVMLVGVLSAPALAGPPPSTDPALATDFGASWLARQLDPAGFLPGGSTPAVTYANTAQAAYGFASADAEQEAFESSTDWLEANVTANVPTDGTASPGLIGYLLLVSKAANIDPTDFGGIDLIDTLEDTITPSGLYGTALPNFDGAFRQALALIGLEAVGIAPDADAVQWLLDQQCDDAGAAFGGWQAFRADTTVACTAPETNFFTGPDTNSTAAAVWALSVLDFPVPQGLAFLEAAQDVNGGFPYMGAPGVSSGVDPNSTAVVIKAIVAAGDSPDEGTWIQEGGNPYTALLSFQIDCDALQPDIGAIESSWAPGVPDQIATLGLIWATSEGDLSGDFVPRHVFTDVCQGSPFQLEIAQVAEAGIIKGFSDGSFHPVSPTTRQAFTAMLYRLNGSPVYTPPTTPTFSDVGVDHPFYEEIEWAHTEGIVNGYADGTFQPTLGLSRQATAAFIFRSYEVTGFTPPATPTFSDVPLEQPFYLEIEWVFVAGPSNGYADGTYGPTNVMTRQATATFLARSLAV